MNFWNGLSIILATILVVMGLNWLYYYILGKRSATMLSQEEFQEGMPFKQDIF